MMKIVIFGLLAAMAYAAPRMGMPPMMMPNMMMGGPGLAGMLSGGIPPEAMEMLKNLKPEDIKNAVANMPPEMKNMMKGMGISEEQLDEAVKNLPEDLTPLIDNVKEKLETIQADPKILEQVELPEGMQEQLKESALTTLKSQMKDMGMDIKDEDDPVSILSKAKETLKEQLKSEGIDVDDQEALQAKIMAEMRKVTDAKPDESDEEVKVKLAKHLIQELKDNGMDVDPEKPLEAMETLKSHLTDALKKMDIDIGEEDFDAANLPNILQKALMSGKFGNPLHVMMSAMATISSGEQAEGQTMMMPMPMPMPQGPQMMHPMRQYVSGAEDALIHVFGGDDEVIQHLMEVREGAMRGAIPEYALFALMQDLLHYRLEARVLLAQNRMLEERLAFNHPQAMPPYTRSPFGLRVLGCSHMH